MTAPGPTLSARELNRAVLARQLLLERADLPITDALERVGGLQTQYAPSGYIGLWARRAGFRRDDLTAALEDRTVVQAWLMRATIHIVSAGDYPLLTEGVRVARREWWVRTAKLEAREVERAAATVREALASGPLWRDELVAELGLDAALWTGVGLWVDLVRAPPSGTWERRRADLYALADDWLGSTATTYEAGLDLLVHRYLTVFGPAAPRDIATWAGLTVAAVRPAVDRLAPRRFRDEAGTTLVDLADGPLPPADTPAPVRFLPTWDATLLVHARRALVVPEQFRPRIFATTMPQSIGTFLVDGQVAGTWVEQDGRVTTTPFVALPARVRREVDAEAERLGTFMR